MKLLIKLSLCLTLGLAFASPALAQDPLPTPSADEINNVAKNMYCPVCENVPLDVCGTLACQQWRAEIADKLSQGWTEEQIYDYFALRFGDRVLARPPRTGLNWLIYIVPPAAFLIGVYILIRGAKTWRKPKMVNASGGAELDAANADQDHYLTQMEEELRNRQP